MSSNYFFMFDNIVECETHIKEALGSLGIFDIKQVFSIFVKDIDMVLKSLECIRSLGLEYSEYTSYDLYGADPTEKYITLVVYNIKRKTTPEIGVTYATPEIDVTYDSIVSITERNKGKITIELFNQVLEKIVESANKGKSDTVYRFNVDNQHLAKDIVDKLKEKGFSNVECHYHGITYIKVNWGLGNGQQSN